MSLAGNYTPTRVEYRKQQTPSTCSQADLTRPFSTERLVYPGFSSTIFRMAMKAHRQGQDTSSYLALLKYSTGNIVDRGFSKQRTAEVRIQCDSLLVREQIVSIVAKSQKMPLRWGDRLYICPHFHFYTASNIYRHGIDLPSADEIEGYKNRQGILCCTHCYTEFRVDFKSYGEAGNAMFVTR